jgi:hypothetical protein
METEGSLPHPQAPEDVPTPHHINLVKAPALFPEYPF